MRDSLQDGEREAGTMTLFNHKGLGIQESNPVTLGLRWGRSASEHFRVKKPDKQGFISTSRRRMARPQKSKSVFSFALSESSASRMVPIHPGCGQIYSVLRLKRQSPDETPSQRNRFYQIFVYLLIQPTAYLKLNITKEKSDGLCFLVQNPRALNCDFTSTE